MFVRDQDLFVVVGAALGVDFEMHSLGGPRPNLELTPQEAIRALHKRMSELHQETGRTVGGHFAGIAAELRRREAE